MRKGFQGKAIYCTSGRAAEYAKWACNLYVGCSSKCEYCYCKSLLRGQWSDIPHLKKSLVNEEAAFNIFQKEMQKNIDELRKYGLFFNFVSDPCLPETIDLNFRCINQCLLNNIPVKILTKQVAWMKDFNFDYYKGVEKQMAFGFTLTNHDELESGAATNAERIEAMKQLYNAGFKVWASIEPIIDFQSSFKMIQQTVEFCNLYKIGLKSGAKYSIDEIDNFVGEVNRITSNKNRIYFKKSITNNMSLAFKLSLLRYNDKFVSSDYNIFENK
jgi:DNA repair photolyase